MLDSFIMRLVELKSRSASVFFTAFFLIASLLTLALASQVFSQPAYTADSIFAELLEVRREQQMSDRIGSSIRFTLKNPLPTEQEFEFEWEELLEGVAQQSNGFDILVKNTTLKEVVVQNKTVVENTISHTETFPNGTITWSELQLVQVDGNPSTYKVLVDSGWVNITQIKDGRAKLRLKPNENIEIQYITYFKRQLGLNKRDVIPAVKVLNQTYKKFDWAVTFENYNKVIGISTSASVENATIWVELARASGFDASVDIRDACQDIRLTNNANDTALKFGIGTLELSGCNTTSGNRTQINFRATSDMNTNPVHVWFNDSAVTTFGNVTWYITNETYDAGDRGGFTTTGSPTFSNKIVKMGSDPGFAFALRNIPAINPKTNGTVGAYGKLLLRSTGDRCRIDIYHNGNTIQGSQRLFGVGGDGGFFAVDDYNQGAQTFGAPFPSTNVQYMMKIELKERLYGKAWLNSIDEHVGWNHSFSNTTDATGITYFGIEKTGGDCEYDDIYFYNNSNAGVGEPRIYNLTSFTITMTPVFTVSGGGDPPASPYLSESSGRDAIIAGIRNALGTSVPIYTDQQIYVRLTNTSQYLGRFDKATRVGSQIWAFNYITDSQTPANVPGVGNALNVLEMVNRTTSANVTTDVQNFIANTRMS